MNEISAIWRTELWHPFSVHYPIALLTAGTIAGLIALICNKKQNFAARLKFTASLLLWSGTALFWVSFYTGNLAYSIEVRRICDPFVLKDHLYWAYVTGFIFSFAAIIDFVQCIWISKVNKWTMTFTVVLMAVGSTALAYTGHLGASLVYQQGAGVHQPSSDCSDYK